MIFVSLVCKPKNLLLLFFFISAIQLNFKIEIWIRIVKQALSCRDNLKRPGTDFLQMEKERKKDA